MFPDSTTRNTSIGNVWYISKYLVPPTKNVGASRGFYLMRDLVRRGYSATVLTSDSNHFVSPPEMNGRYPPQAYESVSWLWVKTIKYQKVKSA